MRIPCLREAGHERLLRKRKVADEVGVDAAGTVGGLAPGLMQETGRERGVEGVQERPMVNQAVPAAKLSVARNLPSAPGEVGDTAADQANSDGARDAAEDDRVALGDVGQGRTPRVAENQREVEASPRQDDRASPRGATQDGDAGFPARGEVDFLLGTARAAQDDDRPPAGPEAERFAGGPAFLLRQAIEPAQERDVEGEVLFRRDEGLVDQFQERASTTRRDHNTPVYLDCAATTPIDPRVRAVVMRHLDEEFGNAGSRTHDLGLRARRAVEHARDQVAAVVAAARGDVLFTSGATESDNLAILGLAAHGQATGRRHVVSTAIEHHAVLGPLEALKARGFAVTLVAPRAGGWVEPSAIAEAVREDTLLVSVMHVNNETGVVQPIADIAERLRRRSAFFHVDAAQGFAKDLDALRHPRIDLISVSGHKIHAPKGVGALVTRRRDGVRPPLSPLMHGGGQERGLRPGTLPVALIAGLGEAAALAAEEAASRALRCRTIRRLLLEGLAPLRPVVNGDPSRTLPHILNLSFPGHDAEGVIEAWRDLAAISDGAACTTQSRTCSHVLSAMGLDERRRDGAVRLSFSHLTPMPDTVRMAAALGAGRTE